MSNQKSGINQSKQVEESDSKANQPQSEDLLTMNIEQLRKIQVMEKQLEFWQNQCIDLKMNLNMTRVQAQENSDEKEDMSRETRRKQHGLEQQVSKLQKDLDSAQNQNKSLKLQLADKEKQIQTFEKQTQQHFDELNDLQEKIKQLKEENYEQLDEKKKLEAQLSEAKKENNDLQNKSTEHSSNQMSPEQYLEVLGEENDLSEMYRFASMVWAKYQLMFNKQQLEALSKGGAGAPPGNFAQFPFQGNGMMGGMSNSLGMTGMVPNMQMGGTPSGGGNMNQMFTNLQQYPQMNTNNAAMNMNNSNTQGNFGPMVPNGFSQDYNNRP